MTEDIIKKAKDCGIILVFVSCRSDTNLSKIRLKMLIFRQNVPPGETAAAEEDAEGHQQEGI